MPSAFARAVQFDRYTGRRGDRLAPKAGDTVAVSAAAGGIGSTVAQLPREKGVAVLAIAAERHGDWLRSLGATPVAYGEGIEARLTEAAGEGGIEGLVDLRGPEYLDNARALGALAADGRLRIRVAATYPLADVVAAMTELETGRADGEIVLEP
ncbi:zinc-binding dehydrogenase [Streptomyces radicis]|nr:zinc-binding dehydrogenase [Streptomyces radicis]